MKKSLLKKLAAGCGALLIAGSATMQAQTLVTQGYDAQFTPADDDLLQTRLSSATLVGAWDNDGARGPVEALYDGEAPLPGDDAWDDKKGRLGPGGSDEAKFFLDTTFKPGGYTIETISFFHAWGDDGRDGLAVDVWFDYVGGGTEDWVYQGQTSVVDPSEEDNSAGPQFDPESEFGHQTAFFSSGNTGVAGIRIEPTAIDNGSTGGFVEVDVIPEPSSLAFAFLGSIGLMMIRRRRRTAS